MTDDWIKRGARCVIVDDRYTYDGESGVVISETKGAVIVQLDGAERVWCDRAHLVPEGGAPS